MACTTAPFRPAEMQYYSSVASIIIQVPCCIFLTNFTQVRETWSTQLLVSYVANGCFFHYQTICAYVLMGYISPVTHRSAAAGFITRLQDQSIILLLPQTWFKMHNQVI